MLNQRNHPGAPHPGFYHIILCGAAVVYTSSQTVVVSILKLIGILLLRSC